MTHHYHHHHNITTVQSTETRITLLNCQQKTRKRTAFLELFSFKQCTAHWNTYACSRRQSDDFSEYLFDAMTSTGRTKKTYKHTLAQPKQKWINLIVMKACDIRSSRIFSVFSKNTTAKQRKTLETLCYETRYTQRNTTHVQFYEVPLQNVVINLLKAKYLLQKKQ